MRKIFVAAALIAAMAGTAAAQGGGGGGGGGRMDPAAMAQRMIDVVYKGVTISDDVKSKATTIITKAQTDMRAIDRSAADAQEQRKKITDQRNADLVALVTSDADKKTVTDNIAAMPARGGRPPVR